jgi:hypothetical protein
MRYMFVWEASTTLKRFVLAPFYRSERIKGTDTEKCNGDNWIPG